MLARLKFDLDPLVVAMLNQIPKDVLINGRILDPCIAGGQFVKEIERIKREAGKTDEEIKNSVYGIENNLLRRDYVLNKYKLVGTYTVDDFLSKDFGDMKFDVIVGNPPYQENTNSEKENKQGDFWFKFLKVATTLTDGYIAFVTPKSIFSSGRFGSDNHKVTYLLNRDFGFKSIWTSVDDHFNVGIKIVSFILEKNYKGSTKLIDINQTVDIDTSIPIPFFLDEINMSIIKKCYNNDNRWPFKECIKAYDTDSVIAINAGRFKTYNKLYIGTQTENPNAAAQGMTIDKTKVESYKSIFNSKLFKYVFCIMGGEDAQSSTGILQGLPYVEPNKIYTDQDLYTKFGLTKEEVDRIDKL